jgi:hypothetical protein
MLKNDLEKQYKKALHIFKHIISNYDDVIWNNDIDYKTPVWQIAYHAIFYTNIYCSATENDIQKWNKERENYNNHQKMYEIRQKDKTLIIPYTKNEILEYIDFVETKIQIYLDKIKPEEKCWPSWYDESQLEFHINNLRHLQHHIGEIIERHDIEKELGYKWE